MATYVVPPPSADFVALRQHGVLNALFSLGSSSLTTRDRLLTHCDDLGLLAIVERFLAALAAEDEESARALRREDPDVAHRLRGSARVWTCVGKSIGPLREKSLSHLRFVPGNAPRGEVLDAIADYLVDLWLDRRDRPVQGGGA